MPVTFNYPGVYVEEIPSGVHTIVGVTTSTTAFIGSFSKGPMNTATRITSFDDFTRTFGGLDSSSETSYCILQYYLNGGQIAYVIRIAAGNPAPARYVLHGSSPPQATLTVWASSPGQWADGHIQIATSLVPVPAPKIPDHFNLVVRDVETVNGRTRVVGSEIYRNLSMVPGDPQYAVDLVNTASTMIQLEDSGMGALPLPTQNNQAIDITSPTVIGDISDTAHGYSDKNFSFVTLGLPAFPSTPPAPLVPNPDSYPGDDGTPPDGPTVEAGMHALDHIDPFIFNLLCLPEAASLPAAMWNDVYSQAAQYCGSHRAFLIVDLPPSFATVQNVTDNLSLIDAIRDPNAATYFPRLVVFDPLNPNKPRNIGPSGTLAGIYARIDMTRGVWKSPAGTEATLSGAGVASTLNDEDNGTLNPLGINVLRNFPIFGNVSWGARTLDGADIMASEWKYISPRRTADYIEESLRQGLKWVVFEPNAEPLWAQIRLNVGAFMHDLFRQGAFQGQTPQQAYFVRCDSSTTTQNDIDQGIVNILVGFAPLKPAEFVVIQLQQMAGQIEV